MSEPVKVLCITGWCRNGSTIIGNVLNEIPGFFHVGELHFLWKNSAGKGVNNLCGCGLPLTGCPVWSPLLELLRPPGTSLAGYADQVIARQLSSARTRHTWRVLRRGLDSAAIREHAELMSRTYGAIAERCGARVIVDTTKIPGEAALLPRLDRVDPYFVHLVRDPRAVAYSWRYWKQYVYPLPPRKSTGYWYGFNLASRAITRRYPRRSLLLRYEDFIADPVAAVDRLVRLCGEDAGANPVTGRIIDLHVNHTVTGNPARFRTGQTEISSTDDGWREGLPARAKLTVLLLAWPLLRRYGYRYHGTFTSAGKTGKKGAAHMDLGIEHRVALIAGGSSGIGLAIAAELAAEGADVAIGARDPERLAAAERAIKGVARGRVRVAAVDVTDRDAARRWVDSVAAESGALHIVVVSGGTPPTGAASQFSLAEYQDAIDLVLLPATGLALAALPHLLAAGWGRILFVASETASKPVAPLALSGVTRAGLVRFAQSLAAETGRDGVTVNVLAPSMTRTPLIERAAARLAGDGDIEDQLRVMGEHTALGRIARPGEIAAMAAFLVSDRASYVTGGVHVVDGGAAVAGPPPAHLPRTRTNTYT